LTRPDTTSQYGFRATRNRSRGSGRATQKQIPTRPHHEAAIGSCTVARSPSSKMAAPTTLRFRCLCHCFRLQRFQLAADDFHARRPNWRRASRWNATSIGIRSTSAIFLESCRWRRPDPLSRLPSPNTP